MGKELLLLLGEFVVALAVAALALMVVVDVLQGMLSP